MNSIGKQVKANTKEEVDLVLHLSLIILLTTLLTANKVLPH